MKVFQINICPDLSTGKIMMDIAKRVRAEGGTCITAAPAKNVPVAANHYVIGTAFSRRIHIVFGKLVGCEFSFSYFSTYKLIRHIRKFDPDVIHLHNLHAYYLNLGLLMEYLATCGKKVVWTFHDCWPFTGHCTHFEGVGCEKWKSGCGKCPQYRVYPGGLKDRSDWKFSKKKAWFAALPELTIVTPSYWLSNLVKQSFFGEKEICVFHNGIDLNVFHPRESGFREKYKCRNKMLLLGVAAHWSERKGLDVFIELSNRLDSSYQIVLVGTDDAVDKQLPDNIISIHRTQNQKELAEIYSAADLFVNPTREENYPTVNMEAIACGTPVLTFRTGGSPEIPDSSCGCVVEKDNVDALEREIRRVRVEKPYGVADCLERAKQFDAEKSYKRYIELYRSIL